MPCPRFATTGMSIMSQDYITELATAGGTKNANPY